MAEERLIDDDEDKKYRLKRNEDGEMTLVKTGEDEESPEEEGEEIGLAMPGDGEVDEEIALMTPEQYALKLEEDKRQAEEREKEVNGLIAKAEEDISKGMFSTALEYLGRAEELDDKKGAVYALGIRAYTRDFTDYSQVVKAAEYASGAAEYADAQIKADLRKRAGGAPERNIASLKGQIESLSRENESAKAERAVKFNKDRNIALILFFCNLASFAIFCGLGGYYAGIMYTVSTGIYIILTCVFAGLAFVFLIVCAFAARRLATAVRRVRLNKRDSSTALGRTLMEKQSELRAFENLLGCMKEE